MTRTTILPGLLFLSLLLVACDGTGPSDIPDTDTDTGDTHTDPDTTPDSEPDWIFFCLNLREKNGDSFTPRFPWPSGLPDDFMKQPIFLTRSRDFPGWSILIIFR